MSRTKLYRLVFARGYDSYEYAESVGLIAMRERDSNEVLIGVMLIDGLTDFDSMSFSERLAYKLRTEKLGEAYRDSIVIQRAKCELK